jgi:UDP-glucose 4-epimerase
MAALLGLKYVFGHPFEVVSENIHSCERLLFLASKKQGPLQLLITSSSCVYGSYSSSVDDTEDTPLTLYPQKYLQQTYATSKITNEVMSLCYSSYAHMHTVIARLFNVIGPNQTGRYGMVVPTFISQALKNEPITIYGSGKQTRSFCSVHDIIKGLDTLLSASSSKNQIYNIGSTEEISILDLAHKIKEKTKSHSPIVFIPYQEAYGFDYEEIQRRQPNINKVKQHIGFAPKVSLDRAIDEIIASQQLRLKDLA